MANKCIFLLICCCIAVTMAQSFDAYNPIPTRPLLVRQARSPQGGSVDLRYNQDRTGKSASVDVNKNLYTSGDKRLTVDAYGSASRHFDQNRNDYGGGVRGSYHF